MRAINAEKAKFLKDKHAYVTGGGYRPYGRPPAAHSGMDYMAQVQLLSRLSTLQVFKRKYPS